MRIINKLKKNENGSVTVFVLAAMLLFIMVSSIMYMEVSNKINAQSKRVEKIQEEYEKRSNSDAIETLYNELNKGINWNKAMSNAKAPESQNEERNKGVIGIGTDGKPVDMDLWKYILLDDDTYCLNDIKDFSGESSTWSKGYIGEYNEDGTIIGEVPQYISTDGKNFKPVTSMLMTFKDCEKLVKQPTLPTTVSKLEYTFWNCTDLTILNEIHNGVITMEGIYMQCSAISEIPELPESVTNLTSAFAKTNIGVAPKIPYSVTIMNNTFNSCLNLIETPYIPDSVLDFRSTFSRLYKIRKSYKYTSKNHNISKYIFGMQ